MRGSIAGRQLCHPLRELASAVCRYSGARLDLASLFGWIGPGLSESESLMRVKDLLRVAHVLERLVRSR